MNSTKKNIIFVLVLLVSFLTIFRLTAQEMKRSLLFSEVYLDNKHPEKSWIEIYNPSDEVLVLEKLRISNARTTNILPLDIKKQGGIEIKSRECLVICVNQKTFCSIWGESNNIVEVPHLSGFSSGGFIALVTKESGMNGIDAFRYGNPEFSKNIKKLKGKQVLGFSPDGKSYSRTISKANRSIKTSDYSITISSPGKKN